MALSSHVSNIDNFTNIDNFHMSVTARGASTGLQTGGPLRCKASKLRYPLRIPPLVKKNTCLTVVKLYVFLFRTYLFGKIVSLLYGTLLCSIFHMVKLVTYIDRVPYFH